MAPRDPAIPRYFDAFLDAIAHGARIDHVHLGHWDAPAVETPETARAGFAQAQAGLAEVLIDRLDAQPNDRILDIGCGFGGVARMLASRYPGAQVCGLNIDERQLRVARQAGIAERWVAADACRLPFAASAFDRVICVEAMFHFASRAMFLDEVCRVLRPGGRVVLSDILIRRPAGLDGGAALAMERVLVDDLGPWPDIWFGRDELLGLAKARGLDVVEVQDASANTLPSYHTIAPRTRAGRSGPTIMRDLHAAGDLRYVYLTLAKR